MTSVASHYIRPLPFHRNQKSDLPNQGLSSTALWRHEDFSQRALTRTTDLLMLGSFNLRCYTRIVFTIFFNRKIFLIQTFTIPESVKAIT